MSLSLQKTTKQIKPNQREGTRQGHGSGRRRSPVAATIVDLNLAPRTPTRLGFAAAAAWFGERER
jgi:hypothetical protein